ncbi:MAG: hypothetical protein V4463_24205 [Pseudomonadota bacterium]
MLLLLVSGSALADDAALLRCRELKDAGPRLACYDAMPVSAPVARAPRAAAAEAPAEVLPSTVPPPALAVTRQEKENAFGFEMRPKKEQLDEIVSYIEGKFEGWGPHSQIRLANGQVWLVVDGSEVVVIATNPKVTITRGSFGSMFMEIEGSNGGPKVRRLK